MAGGHRRAVGSRRQRRLWSGLLGVALLVAGIRRQPEDDEPAEEPEPTGGRSPPRTEKKRGAWMEIARLLYGAIGQHRVVRDRAQWQWITWGSGLAAALWILVSILFSWYAANFGAYNKTYGSLGAVVGFMTWMWISCMVILAGAEVDAMMERLDRGSAT